MDKKIVDRFLDLLKQPNFECPQFGPLWCWREFRYQKDGRIKVIAFEEEPPEREFFMTEEEFLHYLISEPPGSNMEETILDTFKEHGISFF